MTVQFDESELATAKADVQEYFGDASALLEACRFAGIGFLTQNQTNTKVTAYISAWINTQSNDSAQIVAVRAPSPGRGTRLVTLVTYWTEFTDGTGIITSNLSGPSCFPADPKMQVVVCPGIEDLSLMYQFHRARAGHETDGRVATLEQVQGVRSRMEYEHETTYRRLIRAGSYKADERRQLYIPTFRGAYLMVYRLLPPFKQIQAMRRHRITDRTLRELGFGGWVAFQKAQRSSATNGIANTLGGLA